MEYARAATKSVANCLCQSRPEPRWLAPLPLGGQYFLPRFICLFTIGFPVAIEPALAAAFGRHLALPREVLVDLATGGMLLDIGKAALPEELFKHPGPLSPEAVVAMRSHVAEGLKVFDESGLHGVWARDILAGHHERHDGAGYPSGRVGDDLDPSMGVMTAAAPGAADSSVDGVGDAHARVTSPTHRRRISARTRNSTTSTTRTMTMRRTTTHAPSARPPWPVPWRRL